jgi:hypothetical protein
VAAVDRISLLASVQLCSMTVCALHRLLSRSHYDNLITLEMPIDVSVVAEASGLILVL